MSKAFAAIGVKQGNIVVVASVTTPETVYAFYGLNRIGAVANMVDSRTSVEGIREYLSEVNAKYVLTIDVAYSKIEKAVSGSAAQRIIITSPADSLPQPKNFVQCSKPSKGGRFQNGRTFAYDGRNLYIRHNHFTG